MDQEAKHRGEGREDAGLTLLLICSEESEFRKHGRLEGDMDLPLSERGRSRSRRFSEQVGHEWPAVDAIYSAANQSARETAEILSGTNGLRVRVLSELRGISFGLWEGQLLSDVRSRHCRMFEQWWRDPFSLTPPQGESMEEACRRAQAAAKLLRKKHRGGAVAVVAPPPVIGLLYCHLAGQPPQDLFQILDEVGAVRVWSETRVRARISSQDGER